MARPRASRVALGAVAVAVAAGAVVAVAACKDPPAAPAPAPAVAAAEARDAAAPAGDPSCPTGPDATHEIVIVLDGRRACQRYATLVGHGVATAGGPIDVGTDLVVSHGAGAVPRHALDTYPADWPFGISTGGQFELDGGTYNLFAGLGGLPRAAWTTPIRRPVLVGEREYTFARDPARPGAYAQLTFHASDGSRDEVLDARAGTVTFTLHDFERGRYAGELDLRFVGPRGELHLTGAFDVHGDGP